MKRNETTNITRHNRPWRWCCWSASAVHRRRPRRYVSRRPRRRAPADSRLYSSILVLSTSGLRSKRVIRFLLTFVNYLELSRVTRKALGTVWYTMDTSVLLTVCTSTSMYSIVLRSDSGLAKTRRGQPTGARDVHFGVVSPPSSASSQKKFSSLSPCPWQP